MEGLNLSLKNKKKVENFMSDNALQLSDKDIINRVKRSIAPRKDGTGVISIKRGNIRGVDLSKAQDSENFLQDRGIKISVSEGRSRNVNLKSLLNSAYNASLVGQSEAAIFIYKKILNEQPNKEGVLYSLATLYQKLHQYSDAVAVYKKILMINPSHQKAFNNFMVVIAKKYPDEAMEELEDLARINPEFSPIQAQIGMIHAQNGNLKKALIYLKKAVALSPEIVNYKYNLAVIYDKIRAYPDARRLYSQVLEQAQTGAVLPQDYDSIRRRFMYLRNHAK